MGTVKCNDVINCLMAALKSAQERLAMERCFCRDPCDKKGEPWDSQEAVDSETRNSKPGGSKWEQGRLPEE